MNEQGYASRTSNIYLESVAHFAHWSARRHIGPAGINEAAVERFLKHLPLCRCAHRCQRTRPSGQAALGLLLDLLRSEGRIAEKTSPYPAAIAEEINRFEHYLKQVCGLRPATCTVRLQRVRAFLVDRFAHADIRISTVKPADVIRFMRRYTEGWTASSKRAAGWLFRFKAAQGHHTATLSAAIPNVAQWRLARLPKAISADRITRLLRAFDRRSTMGKRDYAITRCFIDLGLHTIEVARLRLDDFDWRRGLVRVSGEGHPADVLPLPHATGHAIADYLSHGRPRSRRSQTHYDPARQGNFRYPSTCWPKRWQTHFGKPWSFLRRITALAFFPDPTLKSSYP